MGAKRGNGSLGFDGSHGSDLPICLIGGVLWRKKTARVRVSRELADEAMGALGVKSKSEPARIAVMSLLGRERAVEETKAARPRRRLNLDKPLIRPAGRRIDITNEKALELTELP